MHKVHNIFWGESVMGDKNPKKAPKKAKPVEKKVAAASNKPK